MNEGVTCIAGYSTCRGCKVCGCPTGCSRTFVESRLATVVKCVLTSFTVTYKGLSPRRDLACWNAAVSATDRGTDCT